MKKLLVILLLLFSSLCFAEPPAGFLGVDSNGNLPIAVFSSDGNEGLKLQDENGTAYGIKHIDNKPRVSSMPYLYDIAEGNIVGHEPIRRYGHNDSVGTSLETVYHVSNLKTYLTSAEILKIVSDDTDDDGSPVGNGARTLTITGLDNDYLEITDTITMDGTTNVLTNIAFLRINEFYVATAGTTGYNEGTISISNNADTIILEQIEPIENEAHCACYTVPAGHTAYIVQAMATEASSKGSFFNFWVRTFGGLWRSKRDIVLLDSVIVVPMAVPMKLPEKTDIEIRVKAILAGAIVTAGFEGWIEEN